VNKINIFHYEPNFIFRVSNLFIGRVKLVFCHLKKDDESFHKHILFILQNGTASPINFIEVISKSIQTKILDDLGLTLSYHVKIYIVNNNNQRKINKELTYVTFSSDFNDVNFEGDFDFEEIGIKKTEVIDALNDYIADAYLPYQILNPRAYNEDFIDNNTFYIAKNQLLHQLILKTKNNYYKDKSFKMRLKQTCHEFVKYVDKEDKIDQSLINFELSNMKSKDPVNEDCYIELGKLFKEVLIDTSKRQLF
jgi:hypothetical protein